MLNLFVFKNLQSFRSLSLSLSLSLPFIYLNIYICILIGCLNKLPNILEKFTISLFPIRASQATCCGSRWGCRGCEQRCKFEKLWMPTIYLLRNQNIFFSLLFHLLPSFWFSFQQNTFPSRILSAYALQVRLNRSGLSRSNRPIASFMFMGPTGGSIFRIIGFLLFYFVCIGCLIWSMRWL